MWVFPKKVAVEVEEPYREEPQQEDSQREMPRPIDETPSTLQTQKVSQRDALNHTEKLGYTALMIIFALVIYDLLMEVL